MNGREDKKNNDLFYTCSLIEYIARKTKNSPTVIVNALGKDKISNIYSIADIYHSDNIDRVSDDFISECGIQTGSFDNVAECRYAVPTHWDIGKVYKRLILKISETENTDVITALIKVFNSGIVPLIEDYNSSFYYDSPDAIYQTFLNDCKPLQ
jgi:hypothetical protein